MSDWNQHQRVWYPPSSVWAEEENLYNGASPDNYHNQYVGFNEFVSQLQRNDHGQSVISNPSNPPAYIGNNQNYSIVNSIVDPNVPIEVAVSQILEGTRSHIHDVSANSSNQYQTETPHYEMTNGTFFTSNLTPTASEFVPKSVQSSQQSSSNQSKSRQNFESSLMPTIAEASGSSSNHYDVKVTDMNSKKNGKNNKKSQPKLTTNEDVGRTFYNSNSKPGASQDVRWRNQDSRYDNRNNKDNNRESYNNWDNRRDPGRENNRTRNSRENGNYTNDEAYNSRDNSYTHTDQRNRYGTHRLQRMDRNSEEDEQYANSYVAYREDRQDSRHLVQSEKLQVVPASPAKTRSCHKYSENDDKSELTQRERLSDQLDRGILECLVCCERVKQMDAVWSCGNCYHVLHLRCVRKWAASSISEGRWRCPACQNTTAKVPHEYRCFCGAARSPEWVRGDTGAHGCGGRCRRARACVHPCVLPCHPGPCPPCQATLNKKCGCGAETRSVVCSSKLEQTCARTCGRQLACGSHYCTLNCHEGDCPPCEKTVEQVCYCPAAKRRTVTCTTDSSGAAGWTCGHPCGRVLECGAHVCREPCHADACRPCALRADNVLACPCGKMKLTEKHARKSCTDPIPLCGNICAKPLDCGPPGDRHFCKLECHEGACPLCADKTQLNCRCSHSSRDVECVNLPQLVDNIFCAKKCNKKLSCGRHRCRELCCALDTHRCPQPCGRMLPCGLHRCAELCHTGHCPPCTRLGFSELRCECGASVLFPPVACGARPPPCDEPCVRPRACGHPPHHQCHSGSDCPPCVVLTTKKCHGGHEERKTIPCHQEEFSCGLPCGKPLPCGKHVCIKVCHSGECATSKCMQQCTEKRPGCGHACGAPCHEASGDDACPSTAPCRLVVRAVCPCKRRSADKTCADNARDFAKQMSMLVASKGQDGAAVDLSDMNRPGANLKTLECDDECRVEARTRQMALVLQIRNPDVSSKLAPRYGDSLRQFAARDAAFAAHVHAALAQLVQRAKQSKQKTRSHSFPSMNRQKRQFIHELCEHFGCEAVAYDAEPNRNVVATADREKSWLPSMSILEVLEREAGKRRVPGPVLRQAPGAAAHQAAKASSSGGWATLTSSRSSSNPWGNRATAAAPPTSSSAAAASSNAPSGSGNAPPKRVPPVIDYFDNPPN